MDVVYRAPAQVQALVMPVGKIRRSKFIQYYDRLQSANDVRLVDISPNKHNDNSLFHPQNYPNGRVLYNFTQVQTPTYMESLFDLEIWRANLLVLAIAHYSDIDSLESQLHDLRDKFKSSSSCQILVFGTPEDHKIDLGPHIIPVLASNYTSLETALCDVTSNLFNNLNALVISKQLGSFKSPSFKALDLPDHTSIPIQKPGRRRHMPKGSSISISRSGSISMSVTERAKARQKGRSLKFMGSLALLTGRISSALDTFAEAATVLKSSHDHLWFASTLDSIGICLLLQAFYDQPVTIPTIVINTVDGETESFVSRYSKSTQHQKLSEFFPSLANTILRYFDRCNPDSEEAVPRQVYQETVLRYTSLLASLRRGGGWNGATLSHVVRNTVLQPNINELSPPVQDIEEWCQVVGQSGTNINSSSDWAAMKALLSIYSFANLGRKWAFNVQQLVMVLASQGESEFVKRFPDEILESLFHQLSNYYTNVKMRLTCIRTFMNLATRMGNLKFVALASGLMLAVGADILPREEQLSLYQVIKDDGEINHQYFNPSLLQDIKLTVPTTAVATTARRTSVQPVLSGSTANTNGAIIYNPFEQDGEQISLIQNDPAPVKVYLKNPFAFELHLAEIYVVDSKGDKISRSNKDVTLPPRTISCTIIDLVPPSPGQLEVSGCWIQASGCAAQTVKLGSDHGDESSHHTPLTLNVLSARPSLALRKTTFNSAWSMLLEGEQTTFSVEISNTSSTESQELQFGFSDSTIDPLRQAIAKQDVTRPEIYELEYFLQERKAIEMISTRGKIPPHDVRKFDFHLNGKRGVSSATILVDSGNDQSTRIRIPLNVTVYPSVELDIIEITQIAKGSGIKGDLVVLLSLRNSWREALDVTVWAEGDRKQTSRLESLRTQRFVLRLNWPFIPPEELIMPVPSLMKKQYIVDTKTTPEMLKSFWLREKLLAKLGGEWTTVNSPQARKGSIEMRGIQLNKRLVNFLSTPIIELTMWIKMESVVVDELFVLYTKAENRSDQEKSGMIRIVCDEPNSSIIVGSLQRPVVIPANDSIVVETKILPLCAGTVEYSSLVDLIGAAPCFQRTPCVIDARGLRE